MQTTLSCRLWPDNAFLHIRKCTPSSTKRNPTPGHSEWGQAGLGYTTALTCPRLNSAALEILSGLLALETLFPELDLPGLRDEQGEQASPGMLSSQLSL